MPSSSNNSSAISRRKYLGGLIAGTAALSGCMGGGGGAPDDTLVGEAGERVPQIVANFWSDSGSTTDQAESFMPIIAQNLDEIGIDFNPQPNTLTSTVGGANNDERSNHFINWTATMTPERLDPDPQTYRWNIGWAGANGRGNAANYASCEYTDYALQQRRATDEEERREAVMNAHKTWAGDVGYIPMYPDPQFGAYWEDSIDAGGIGDMGIVEINSPFKIESSSVDGDTIRAATQPAIPDTATFPTNTSSAALATFNNCFLSPLIAYDENQELTEVLAEDYTVEDDATTFRFHLREATAHNGERITAEDVKFSAEFFQENRDFFPKASETPYESIDVIDEQTVEFNTTESFLPLIGQTLPRWGVLPRAMQEFVEEDPSSWSGDPGEDWVGTGPYQISNFDSGESVLFEPHDGHPIFEPESNYLMIAFSSTQAAVRSFEDQEVDVFPNAPPDVVDELEEEGAEVVATDALMEAGLCPQCSFGPTQFREFRMAVSQAIDRDLIVQSAVAGRSEANIRATIWSDNHPWMNTDELPAIADSTSSNPDAAREVLEENGWTFDDDGNLHYPEDIDLTPRWPEGSEPAAEPDDFPCVGEFGFEPRG